MNAGHVIMFLKNVGSSDDIIPHRSKVLYLEPPLIFIKGRKIK